jgi:hypothetical protein
VSGYTRRQLVEILEVEESFVVSLEREEIVEADLPGDEAQFSERMLERVRVAWNLVHELEVNLPGVAIILRLREDLGDLRGQLEELARLARTRR